MITIKIDEKYYWEIGSYNFILYKKGPVKDKKTKKTKEGTVLIGYYPNLRSALRGLANHYPMLATPTSIKSLTDSVRKLYAKIETIANLSADELAAKAENKD